MNIDPIQAKVDGFILDNSILLKDVSSKLLREAMYKLLKEVVESFEQPAKLTQKEIDAMVGGPSYWKSAIYQPVDLQKFGSTQGTISSVSYDPNQLVYAGQPNSSRSEDFGEISKVHTGRIQHREVIPLDYWSTGTGQ